MLKEILNYFNVKMISIANYTGFSLDTLRSLSSQRRTYNITLLNELLILYKALLLKTPVKELSFANEFLHAEKQNSIIALQQQLHKIKKQLIYHKKVLKEAHEKRNALLRGLNACNVLLQKKQPLLTTKSSNWVLLRKKHLQQKLNENSLQKQILLTAKVKSLHAKLKVVNDALK